MHLPIDHQFIIICSYRILTFYSPLPVRPPLQYIQFACQYTVLVELSSFHLGITVVQGGYPPTTPLTPLTRTVQYAFSEIILQRLTQHALCV